MVHNLIITGIVSVNGAPAEFKINHDLSMELTIKKFDKRAMRKIDGIIMRLMSNMQNRYFKMLTRKNKSQNLVIEAEISYSRIVTMGPEKPNRVRDGTTTPQRTGSI